MANHLQTYESLRLIAFEALGGTSSAGTSEDEAIGTWEELAEAFAAVGGTLG